MYARIVVVIAVAVLGCASAHGWEQVWSETLGGQNVYYCGGVFDGTYYTGQIYAGPQQWGATQSGDPATALLHGYATLGGVGAKSSVPLGGYIFMGDGNGSAGIGRVDADWASNETPRVKPTARAIICDSLATDGTYLYTDEYAAAVSQNRALVHKFAVNNLSDPFTLTEVTTGNWSGGVNTGATGRIRAVSFFSDKAGGKLYCGDHDDASQPGDRLFEIDAVTGSVKTLGVHWTSGVYQVYRYGNQLFVTDDVSDSVTIYDVSSGTLGANFEVLPLGLGDLYGIGVDGNGTVATKFWVSSIGAVVSHYRSAAPLAGDANEDGKVDDLDASILAANWQRAGDATWGTADFNGDTNVNDLDASILAANWQAGVGAALPEPGTLALLAGLAAPALLRRRPRW